MDFNISIYKWVILIYNTVSWSWLFKRVIPNSNWCFYIDLSLFYLKQNFQYFISKAIDIWMGACTAFIFAALLEFTLTKYLWRKGLEGRLRQSNEVTSFGARTAAQASMVASPSTMATTTDMPLGHRGNIRHIITRHSILMM